MSELVVKAFVDRIEGDTAVLLVGDALDEVNVPRRFLPPDAAEGSALIVRFQVDQDAATERKQRIARLIEELGSQSAE